MESQSEIYYLLKYQEPLQECPIYFAVKPNGEKVCDFSSSSIENMLAFYEGLEMTRGKITLKVPDSVLEIVKGRYAAPQYITRANGKGNGKAKR
ncbi:hypothetical protein JXB28_01245 [Candidatus Woesearchaeota archaeon]|nr:hypothetical protein [Candidatus Woesearchaeota archaeon]